MPLAANASTIVGACIAIAASILNAIGYTIQKEGHNKLKSYNNNNSNSPRKKKIVQDKTWCIGFWIFILGGCGNAMALYYAPQSLVLPLSAVTLVVNTVLATQLLGEPFMKTSICGIALVIIGSTLAVIFGPRTGGIHVSIDDLKERWGDLGYLLFFLFLSGITVIDYIGIKYFEKKNLMDEEVENKEIKYGKTFLLLSYGWQNGYYGSNAFLFLKAFTEFLGGAFASSKNAQAALKSWFSYFIFFAVISSNVLYVMWQQRGLSYFPSVYVIPINQVTLIVMGTVLGGVYFDEFDNYQAVNAAMFVISIILTSCGVIVLAAGHTMFKEMGMSLPLKVNDLMESGKLSQVIEQNGNSSPNFNASRSEISNNGIATANSNGNGLINHSASNSIDHSAVLTNATTDYLSVDSTNIMSINKSFIGAAAK